MKRAPLLRKTPLRSGPRKEKPGERVKSLSATPKRSKFATDDAKWSRDVKKRDGHQCQQCGRTDSLESHHLYPRVPRYYHLRHDLANGVTLCIWCHQLGPNNVHRDLKACRDWWVRLSPEFAALREKQGEVKAS